MKTFIIRTETHRQSFIAWVRGLDLSAPLEAVLKPYMDSRSLAQNRRMWAMLTDIAQQKQGCVNGKMVWLKEEEWKIIFSASLKGELRIASGLNGEAVVLGESTSKMTIKKMCDLQELMAAFGAENGVKFRAPEYEN